jgi:Ribonuclease G/E
VKTAITVCYEIFRRIRSEGSSYKEPLLVINCNGEVARLLQGEERDELRHLMDRYNKSIQVKAQQNYHREQYDFYSRPPQQGERPMRPGQHADAPGGGEGAEAKP